MATAVEILHWLGRDKNAPRQLDAVLSHQPREVREQVERVIKNYDFAASTGGKPGPFMEPVTVKDVNEHYGLNPKTSARVFQNLVDVTLTRGLQERMGTDDKLPVPETTLRDSVAAAVELHHPDFNPE